MKEIVIKNLAGLDTFARGYAAKLEGGRVIGLVGELGAGKTTFVQHLAKALGVKPAVKSPTFILLQAFATGAAAKKRGITQLCHVDAYRLKDFSELRAIGFEEYAADPGTLCVVEWADRVPELHGLPVYEEITFIIGKEGLRRLQIGR